MIPLLIYKWFEKRKNGIFFAEFSILLYRDNHHTCTNNNSKIFWNLPKYLIAGYYGNIKNYFQLLNQHQWGVSLRKGRKYIFTNSFKIFKIQMLNIFMTYLWYRGNLQGCISVSPQPSANTHFNCRLYCWFLVT